MRSIVVILLSVMVIGAGCVLQRAAAPESVETAPSVQVASVFGVLTAWDEETRTAVLHTATGGIEEVLWPAKTLSAVDRVGQLVRILGERDLTTLRISATTVEFVTSPDFVIVSPESGATVTSPLLVNGFARVPDQVFEWRVRDASGAEIANGVAAALADAPKHYGTFAFEVYLPALAQTGFTLEVLEAMEGGGTALASVSLNMLSTKTSTFSVYFSKPSEGSNEDCALVFPVARTVAQTSAVGRAALLELLNGPTEAELAQGYVSSLALDSVLLSLVISGGTATADFNAAFNQVAGSCRVQAIRSQVDHTLAQFPSVTDIVISVEGDAATALQP